MKHLFFLWLLLLPPLLNGQVGKTYSGQLLEAETAAPIPYASLQIEGTTLGGVSNAKGQFSLVVPEGAREEGTVLRISCLGYHTRRISLSDLDFRATHSLELTPNPYTLGAVMIYGVEISPKEMLHKAFEAVPFNYPNEAYQWQSFYRHYCREGEEYGRLIEAVVDLYDGKGHHRQYATPRQKLGMQIVQLRRSFDFTRFSAYQHLPIALNNTLLADVASYSSIPTRHRYSPRLAYTFADTTFFDGQLVFAVRVTGRIEKANYVGTFYLQLNNLAILKAEMEYQSSYRNETVARRKTDHFVVEYRPYRGQYYVNYLLNEGSVVEQQLDSLRQVIFTDDHYHHVEMMTQKIMPEAERRITGKEPRYEEMLTVSYDPAFWNQYSVLQATPLEQEIEADLAQRMPLHSQFSAVQDGSIDPVLQDDLAQGHLAELLQLYQGRTVILGFWNSETSPGLRDLVKAKKLMKAFEETPFSLILISTDPTDAQWQAAIRRKRLLGPEHLRVGQGIASPLVRRYGVKETPWFVLLDAQGKQILGGTELPRVEQVKAVLSND